MDTHHIKNFAYTLQSCTLTNSITNNQENRSVNNWYALNGVNVSLINQLASQYTIHPLILEDLFSKGQRPKVDEIENIIYFLLPSFQFNNQKKKVHHEQVSLILGNNFLISIQENDNFDPFEPVYTKLNIENHKLRHTAPDYLCYTLIDIVVDNYLIVLEKMQDTIDQLELKIGRSTKSTELQDILFLREETTKMRRKVFPVREVLSKILDSENPIIHKKTLKYFKDVHDHLALVYDRLENQRDSLNYLQDLYLSKVNLKLNETMRILTIVTVLLAPATVIGGIFGMNFDVIPFAHQNLGFYMCIGLMFLIPLFMLIWFKYKDWL